MAEWLERLPLALQGFLSKISLIIQEGMSARLSLELEKVKAVGKRSGTPPLLV